MELKAGVDLVFLKVKKNKVFQVIRIKFLQRLYFLLTCRKIFCFFFVLCMFAGIDLFLSLNTIFLKNTSLLLIMFFFLKNSMIIENKFLAEISAADYPRTSKRYNLVYLFLNPFLSIRMFVGFFLHSFEQVPSLSELYASANWLEREIWDMFGIFFQKNKDLRRILTDYNFKGHPLKKDFPLTGYREVHYDVISRRVKYYASCLTQEYRNFFYKNPWIQNVN